MAGDNGLGEILYLEDAIKILDNDFFPVFFYLRQVIIMLNVHQLVLFV